MALPMIAAEFLKTFDYEDRLEDKESAGGAGNVAAQQMRRATGHSGKGSVVVHFEVAVFSSL